MNTPMDPENRIDLEEVARLVETLEADIARLRQGQADPAQLRAEVEQLRAALAAVEQREQHVERGLQGLRERLHQLGDELFDDAVKSGEYITRIGRLLGL
jgi:chromosome segregation ATPase